MNNNMTTPNKTLAVIAGFIALVGFQTYAFVSTRSAMNDRMAGLESEIQKVQANSVAQATQVSSDLGVITNKMGVTAQELDAARQAAAQFKEEEARTAARLRNELAQHSKAVDSLREESTTKLAEVQEQAASQIGAVSGQIGAVSGEVDTVKGDLASAKSDLAAKMVDMRDSLGREIARNSDQLSQLKLRGERNYYEFNIPKAKVASRLADIQVLLKKADTKKQRYDVELLVDDSRVEKKGQLVNEPVTFLVGRDHLRYELVVYAVDKDRIRGYVSTPKDKVLSAEGPTLKQ
jgi:hypothetical protein